MREITRERLIEDRDILLFDILQELKKMTSEKEKDKPKEKEIPKEKRLFDCKYCGKKHEEPWQIAKCGKNLKKEGGK